jgi:hypothetical protein
MCGTRTWNPLDSGFQVFLYQGGKLHAFNYPYEPIDLHHEKITYGMTIITCNLTVMLVQQNRSIAGGLKY